MYNCYGEVFMGERGMLELGLDLVFKAGSEEFVLHRYVGMNEYRLRPYIRLDEYHNQFYNMFRSAHRNYEVAAMYGHFILEGESHPIHNYKVIWLEDN